MSIQYPEKFSIESRDGSVNVCQSYVFGVYVILKDFKIFMHLMVHIVAALFGSAK